MVYDFHTHSIFSDGELIPSELVRRAFVNGYEAVAITDHVDFSNLEPVLSALRRFAEHAPENVFIGVEITHVPPDKIEKIVLAARRLGAEIIVVHGETLTEPVYEGTNAVAVRTPGVDILAHPGLLSPEDAELAAENEVFIEITSRKGHCLTNGHVARVSREAGAKLLLNTDAHAPGDLINDELAAKIVRGAGLGERDTVKVLRENPKVLIKRIAEKKK
ncbi:MAG TPA: histidinol phosphate phosphatase domain-containing protein [Methanomicrobia archaeon]|nr:Histidinol phosphatase or related hydrolase of the PHP family [Candidatus Alkanophaga volatiphilum]HDO63353.1 histidinol phosphate phosphatase domain-containing protein [Methanomicrobia archaeon]HEX58946.1 histidinol phosphate phosphatase domain-containing protein [Methanomicrobia archaeon]